MIKKTKIKKQKKSKLGSFIYTIYLNRRPRNRLTKILWSLANPLYPCKSSKYINYHIT